MKYLKEKITGILSSLSGATSILGSWQVCHNICLGLIVLLSIIGITVTGMPLLFLTKIAVPLWTIALVLLILTIIFYLKKKCISKGLIFLNIGFITAGTPFQKVQEFIEYFWIVGGIIAIYGIILLVQSKLQSRSCEYEKKKKRK